MKSRYARHRHVEPPRLGFNDRERGRNRVTIFFFVQQQKRSRGREDVGCRRADEREGEKEGEREGWREEGREEGGGLRKDTTRGEVLYPLVGGLRFKATSP